MTTAPKTLEHALPPNNPLASFPYWGSSDGKNLNTIQVLEWAVAFLAKMETELPCGENRESIWHLSMAIKLQTERQQRRREQGLLGTNKPHKLTPYNIPPEVA